MNTKIKTQIKFILLFCFILLSSYTLAEPSKAPTSRIKQTWEFKNNAFNNTITISDDGTIYFIANENHLSKLYALTPAGIEKWHITLPYQIYSAPCVDAKGMIYLFGRDSTLYAFYPTGHLKWQIMIPHNYVNSANLYIPLTIGKWSHRVYVSTMHGNIFAVNADGTIGWKYTPKQISNITTPILEYGDKKNPLIYFVLNRDYLKPGEHTEIHQFKQMTDNIILSRSANIYYFTLSSSGRIYAIFRKNYASTIEVMESKGKLLWNTRSDGTSVIGFLDKDSTFYYVGIENNKNFVAARDKNGKLLWKNNYPNRIYDVLLTNDQLTTIYNTSFDPARQKILTFAKNNGQLKCESDEFKYLFAYPSGKDHHIYLSTNIGVTALEMCP